MPESHLVRANALHGQSGQAARLIGALAGGLAVGAGGLAAVVWIDVAGFLLCAAAGEPADVVTGRGRACPGAAGAVRAAGEGRPAAGGVHGDHGAG
ncbi:hypothetical protein ACFQYP_06985 [Nonomuraea antimicrobica]